MTAATNADDVAPRGRRDVGDPSDTVGVLRRALLGLALLGITGTAFELASERHWRTTVQLIPWGALAAALVAIALVWRGGRTVRRAGRILAIVIMATSVLGIVEHVIANHEAGPLDAVYGARWASMSGLSQWWAAFIKSVGPAPTLAPFVLAWVALCILLATVRTHDPER
ncbi:MAG: hypothetical protein JWM05_454 [Acidimicrobiales bacterium]|nr:hypothetical protein [Acidimicrobiales bacterium]